MSRRICRIISILIVCAVVLPCVFADSFDGRSDIGYISVTVSPYSYQWINVKEDLYLSDRGYAASIGYMKNVWKGLEIGADFGFSSYKQFKLEKFGTYINLGLTLKACWKFHLSENVFAGAGIGLGYEASLIGEKVYSAVCADLYGKIGFDIDDTFALFVGADAKASMQKGFYALAVSPSIGTTVAL